MVTGNTLVIKCKHQVLKILFIKMRIVSGLYSIDRISHICQYIHTVGVKLKFPFGFRSTEPKW